MAFRMNGENFGSNHNQKLDSLRELFPRNNPKRSPDCHAQILAVYAYRAANDLPICPDEYEEMPFDDTEYLRDDMTATADDMAECNVDCGARIDAISEIVNNAFRNGQY